MSATTVVSDEQRQQGEARRRSIRTVYGLDDKMFFRLLLIGALSILFITLAIGLFLALKSTSAIKEAKFSFLTTQQWQPDVHKFGIGAVLPGTVFIALVALVVSFPLGLGVALFISEIVRGRLQRYLQFGIDAMAAVPSVVYGLFGLLWVEQHSVGVSRWISTWFGWVPFLKVPGANGSLTAFSASTFIAGLIVAVMMIPIEASIMREAFSQAPAGEREGAFALGATRWGMIRSVVLPFGRGGIIGGTMLALGRALGETVAVLFIISPVQKINWHILSSGGNSIAALIANLYSEASAFGLSALMAAGLALFIMTMIVNFTASAIISRSRSGAISE